MPRGDKDSYSSKQKRKAAHIAEGYLEKGVPEERAEEIAWATVNKQDGGGAKKERNAQDRSAAARKGWITRRRNSRKNQS